MAGAFYRVTSAPLWNERCADHRFGIPSLSLLYLLPDSHSSVPWTIPGGLLQEYLYFKFNLEGRLLKRLYETCLLHDVHKVNHLTGKLISQTGLKNYLISEVVSVESMESNTSTINEIYSNAIGYLRHGMIFFASFNKNWHHSQSRC